MPLKMQLVPRKKVNQGGELFTEDQFTAWFVEWVNKQREASRPVLTHMFKLKFNLFTWSNHREMLKELASVLEK